MKDFNYRFLGLLALRMACKNIVLIIVKKCCKFTKMYGICSTVYGKANVTYTTHRRKQMVLYI